MTYVMSFEKFDELELSLVPSSSTQAHIVVEYASKITGPRRLATDWTVIPNLNDTTHNLTRSGILRWKPPLDWQCATYSDGSGRSYGGGQFFGNGLMAGGGIAYAVRIRWTGTDKGPTLNSLTQRRWIRNTNAAGTLQVVPGWDSANDRNSDGYVDDTEMLHLVNPRATARMRQEGRVFTLGQYWSVSSSGVRVNVWNKKLVDYIADYQTQTWKSSGQLGSYNDDMLKMLGPDIFPLNYGGQLAEYDGTANSTTASEAFQTGFTQLLAAIKTKSHSKYLSGNIGGVNLFVSNSTRQYIPVLDVFLQESYLTAGVGLTGFSGIQKMWDTAVYAKVGKISIIQGQAWNGAAQLISKTVKVCSSC